MLFYLRKLVIVAFWLLSGSLYAQKTASPDTSTTLGARLSTGQLKFSVRNFSMLTDNATGLKDYFSNGLGMGIRYETKPWKGFQAAFSGFVIFNLSLNKAYLEPDPTTGVASRYESGFYDLLDTKTENGFTRLEEFYLRYNFGKSKITLGQQPIATPFVNLQDGRIRPTLMSGLWIDFNEVKNLHLEGGWLWRSSPRSTVRWYDISESLGIYSQGTNIDGTKGNYFGNINTSGLLVLGSSYGFSKNSKLSLWNYYLQNVFNIAHLQHIQDYTLTKKWTLRLGAQLNFQQAIADGGNTEQTKTYIAKNSKAMTLGGRVGLVSKNNVWLINYTRITKDGRFQFPREWGIEPFFTFMPRERNEGLGDVHAVNTTFSHNVNKQLSFGMGVGHYQLADVKNTKLNKYGLPSYYQINADVRYRFKGFFDGLDLFFLVALKKNDGETYNNDKYRINKVDMGNYNLVVNYSF